MNSPVQHQEAVQPQPDADAIKMFVGQIPRSWDENELRNLFEDFGKVHSINVLRDKATGSSRGEWELNSCPQFQYRFIKVTWTFPPADWHLQACRRWVRSLRPTDVLLKRTESNNMRRQYKHSSQDVALSVYKDLYCNPGLLVMPEDAEFAGRSVINDLFCGTIHRSHRIWPSAYHPLNGCNKGRYPVFFAFFQTNSLRSLLQ